MGHFKNDDGFLLCTGLACKDRIVDVGRGHRDYSCNYLHNVQLIFMILHI